MTVTERVLCFYCYWLCWVDIAVGLLVCCLKDNRMNRLTPVKSGLRCTVQPFAESDNSRCCENIILPPEDGHVMLETCRG